MTDNDRLTTLEKMNRLIESFEAFDLGINLLRGNNGCPKDVKLGYKLLTDAYNLNPKYVTEHEPKLVKMLIKHKKFNKYN